MSTAMQYADASIRRDEARAAVGLYQSRTGMSLKKLALETGYSYYSMRHLAAGVDYSRDGQGVAEAALEFIRTHPAILHECPGVRHETTATRKIDAQIAYCQQGGWGTLYGPTGSQKTFDLTYRAALEVVKEEPGIALVKIPGPMTPRGLLALIAREVGASYEQSSEGLRGSIVFTVRNRRTPLALILDEADLLYKSIDALEVLRRLGDELPVRPGRAGIGLLVVGNEDILRLFEPRRGNYFGRWRGRIRQQEVRVLGPTPDEAAEIVRAELGNVPAAVVSEAVEPSSETDPVTKKKYVCMHYLFNAMAGFRRRRAN